MWLFSRVAPGDLCAEPIDADRPTECASFNLPEKPLLRRVTQTSYFAQIVTVSKRRCVGPKHLTGGTQS
jgi:hypothetical protein